MLAVLAPGLRAQAVRGQLVEAETRRPIAGALIVLLDASDAAVGGSLTNSAGGFEIEAPQPGRYRLRSQRIGFQSNVTSPFDLLAGETAVRNIITTTIATQISGVTVDARNPCNVRPAVGRPTAQLWEEARKALEAAAFTQRERLYRFQIRTFVRKVEPGTLAVLADSVRQSEKTMVADRPFISAPAEGLLRDGFVQRADDGITYYAPDADVLLSDEFLDEYCFEIVRNVSEPELVGLGFRPVSNAGPPGLRGTLWLDSATMELRHLDYGYARLSLPRDAESHAGGRIEFEALTSGAWIVRRWAIRMPTQVTVRSEVDSQDVTDTRGCGSGCFRVDTRQVPIPGAIPRVTSAVTGLWEEGGEVIAVLPMRGQSIPARVTGVVFDSVTNSPLANAMVYLSGTQYSDTTDANGRFDIEGVPAGQFGMAFAHPRLSRLRYYPPLVQVEVAEGETANVELATSSVVETRALARLCPNLDPSLSAPAALLGELRDVTSRPLGATEVRATWSAATGPGGSQRSQFLDARTSPEGGYVICGVAANQPISLMIRREGRVVHEVSVPAIPTSRVWVQDIELPASAGGP